MITEKLSREWLADWQVFAPWERDGQRLWNECRAEYFRSPPLGSDVRSVTIDGQTYQMRRIETDEDAQYYLRAADRDAFRAQIPKECPVKPEGWVGMTDALGDATRKRNPARQAWHDLETMWESSTQSRHVTGTVREMDYHGHTYQMARFRCSANGTRTALFLREADLPHLLAFDQRPTHLRPAAGWLSRADLQTGGYNHERGFARMALLDVLFAHYAAAPPSQPDDGTREITLWPGATFHVGWFLNGQPEHLCALFCLDAREKPALFAEAHRLQHLSPSEASAAERAFFTRLNELRAAIAAKDRQFGRA